PARDTVAGARTARPPAPERARLGGRPGTPRAAARGHAVGGSRRDGGRAPRARRSGAPGGRHESLRARLPPAVPPCVALAPPRAPPTALGPRRIARRGAARPAPVARFAGLALRAGTRRALVSGRADGHRLRSATGGRDRGRLACRRRSGRRAFRRSLRALSKCGRATAARAHQRVRQASRPYSEGEEARIGERAEGEGDGRMSMRRTLRIVGTTLVVAGALVLIWVGIVWRWQDPFTALYTHWKQHQLAHSYERRFAAYRASPNVRGEASLAARMRAISREAHRYRLSSRRGEAIGRIRVPRLHLKMILV